MMQALRCWAKVRSNGARMPKINKERGARRGYCSKYKDSHSTTLFQLTQKKSSTVEPYNKITGPSLKSSTCQTNQGPSDCWLALYPKEMGLVEQYPPLSAFLCKFYPLLCDRLSPGVEFTPLPDPSIFYPTSPYYRPRVLHQVPVAISYREFKLARMTGYRHSQIVPPPDR